MQLITYLITGIILALVNYFLFEKNNKLLAIIRKSLIFIVLSNLLSLSIIKYFLKMPKILDATTYSSVNSFKYSLFTLFLGFIYLFIKWILTSKITFSKLLFTKASEKSSKKIIILKVLTLLFFVTGMIFIFFSNWFIDYFGNITPEQFLFNLKSPLKGTSSDMSKEILHTPVFAILASTAIFSIFMNFKYEIFIVIKNSKKKILSLKVTEITSFILSLILLVLGVSHGVDKLKLDEVASAYFSNSTFIEDNYKDPRDINMSFPEKKRNLIHIYLESVENSFFSEDLGGHMKINLMPELAELTKEGISFSNNDKLGGPYQTYGSSWSVASMINMGSGIPLKIPMDNNSYGKSGSFLPGVITIGDILEAQGYNQTIMFGADADFGGLTTYFNSHGNFNIFDLKAARAKKLIPDDYYVWWGYEDDKLYEYAKAELTRLHNEGKPFNFTMETADTHFPDGYLPKNAERKHDSQYANVIANSTKEAVKLIRWIQEQPFYENTTVVVTGDHLSMDKNFFTNFDPDYHRTVFNLILNSPISTDTIKNRDFAPYDMFPTILASMDVRIDGDRLGLGTNLFSPKATLIEEKGLENVEKELGFNSNFFTDEFINEKKTSIFENTLIKEHSYK